MDAASHTKVDDTRDNEGRNQPDCALRTFRNEGRRGIALVVVLGFLAVLTLMAVGMAISMRTERLASKSYLDMVNARLNCQASLAYSMQDVEDYLTSLGDPKFKIAPAFINSFSHWGDWVLPSYDKDAAGRPDLFTNSLIHGTGTNFAPYIPGLCWPVLAESGPWADIGSVYREAEWIHTTKELPSGQTVTNGRFMYLIFDNTVGIDMNFVGKKDPFGFRMSGEYIKCFGDGNESFSEFTNNRSFHVRYETLKDIKIANDLASYFRKAEFAPWSGPSDMTSFSYFPPMGRIKIEASGDIVVEDMAVLLSTNINEWNESEIVDQFESIVTTSSWKDAEGACDENDLYELLYDFADEDKDPYDANSVSVEPIPMVSEFMIGTNSLDVEMWSPFVGSDTNRYTDSFYVGVSSGSQSYDKDNIKFPDWEPRYDLPVGPMNIPIVLTEPITNTLSSVEIVVKTSKSGRLLDRVILSEVVPGRSYQCSDPRFNHLESQWKDFDEGSPGAINQHSKNGYADSGGTPGGKGYVADGDYLMYCANRPLRCTGELGYLPVAPWRTIKLYEDPRNNTRDLDPVLDYFAMTTNVVSGLVNPNDGPHRSHDVALDVNNKADGGLFRNYIDEPEMGPNDTGYFRNKIRNHIRNRKVFTNLSDLGLLYNENIIAKYKGNAPQRSELRLEHAMRRISGVYNLRSSLFLVCLWGQALGPEPTDPGDRYSFPVKAEAQAVALVWRDPYPDENGRHRKFIRYMRWLE